MPPFSITTEEQKGFAAGTAWLAKNSDHPGTGSIALLSLSNFAVQSPETLQEYLALDDPATWLDWWTQWGTEQPPSHSFTRGFCTAVNAAHIAALGQAATGAASNDAEETAEPTRIRRRRAKRPYGQK